MVNRRNDELGKERERLTSLSFHQKGLGLLVDPTLLRDYGLGQIDLARISDDKIDVWEVKGKRGPQYNQHMRIMSSCDWLGQLFQVSVFYKTKLFENSGGQEESRFLP